MKSGKAISFNQIPLKKNMDLVTKYHIKSANKLIYYLILMALAVVFVLSVSSLGLSVHNYQEETSLTLPGGSNRQVQFNDSGSFDGDSGLVYNQTEKKLTVTKLTAGGNTYPTTQGNPNDVLTTDGLGNLSFTNTVSNNINGLLDASANTTNFEKSIMLGQKVSSLASNANFNTGVGLSAMTSITTGTSNVVIGFNAGNGITTGFDNVIIGSNAGTHITTQNNLIVIGSGAKPSGSQNEITLGNSSIDTIRCGETTLTTLSDGRDKINVEDTQFGLDFLMKLRPVDYTWQRRILEPGDINHHKNGKRRSGFIAQELLDAVGEEGNNVLDLVYQTNPERLEVKYGNLIPSLVKSIQQLENKVRILEDKLLKQEGSVLVYM